MIGNKRILSVITARAGSKGIKNKNFKELCGKPLFMWSVLASLQSEYVDRTVVSSDCPKVESIVKEYKDDPINKDVSFKLVFIKRPKKYSGDLSKNEDALIHAIQCLKNKEKFKIVVNLQPTSPCRLDGLLDKAIEAYHEGGYNSLLTAKKDTPFIWQRIDGKWEYTVDKHECCDRKMRQEFIDNETNSEFIFHDSGCIYIVDSKILLETKCRIGYNPCIFETVGLNSLQIDDEHTFMVIEKMIEAKGLDSLI